MPPKKSDEFTKKIDEIFELEDDEKEKEPETKEDSNDKDK